MLGISVSRRGVIRTFVVLGLLVALLVMSAYIGAEHLLRQEIDLIQEELSKNDPACEISPDLDSMIRLSPGDEKSFFLNLAGDILKSTHDLSVKPSPIEWNLKIVSLAAILKLRYNGDSPRLYCELAQTYPGQGLNPLGLELYEKNFSSLNAQEAAYLLVLVQHSGLRNQPERLAEKAKALREKI